MDLTDMSLYKVLGDKLIRIPDPTISVSKPLAERSSERHCSIAYKNTEQDR